MDGIKQVAWACPVCNKIDWNDKREAAASPQHIPYRGYDIGSCPGKMVALYVLEPEAAHG